MSVTKHEPSADELRQQADVVRGRLADTLDALNRRRHQLIHELLDWKGQLRKHAVPLAIAGTSTALILLGSGGAALYRSRRRHKLLPRERLRALVRAWKYPERVAQKDERSIPVEIGRHLVVNLVTAVAVAVGKEMIQKAMASACESSGKDTRGGTRGQHAEAGRQSHKNS